jgi:TatD DNase family protein
LDLDKFDADRGEVIQRARDEGVECILIPALNLDTWPNLIKLTQYHAGIYTAFGFHPTEVDKWNNSSAKNLRLLLEMEKVVAVGEIGLDYYWVKELDQQAYQREILKQQLKLATEVNRPVIIHMREQNDVWFGQASIDLLDILTNWCRELRQQNHPLATKPGVLHSFNGNLETAQTAITLNFYIGVTGPVTYKKAEEKRQIIRQLPLERLLIETDSPFLAPVPHRGKRNEPAFVAHIADKIAEIHSTTREQIAHITASNAANLFGWGG